MQTVAETFKIETSRPLSALDKTSIAELAQFTHFDPQCHVTACAAADEAIRKAFDWEVDDTSEMSFLDFKKARVAFKDGSTLTFAIKRKN